MEQVIYTYGWICPRCATVMSPSEKTCEGCYRIDAKKRTEEHRHELNNCALIPQRVVRDMEEDLLLHGKFYGEMNRDRWIERIDPATMEDIHDASGEIIGFVRTDQCGRVCVFDISDIVHVNITKAE